MRNWRWWFDSLILASQYNPPRFVEIVMLTLALIFLAISMVVPQRPYLVLCLSLVVGASVSILVREAIAPSLQPRITKLSALILLTIGICDFISLLQTFSKQPKHW